MTTTVTEQQNQDSSSNNNINDDNDNNNSNKKYDLLLDRFRANVQKNPNKLAISYLTSIGTIERSLTYKELDTITTSIAYRLRYHYKIPIGDRVVLVYPPSIDFMISFVSCCKANVIAVPVFPPNPLRKDSIAMFCKIINECTATYALTNQQYDYNKKLVSIKESVLFKNVFQTTSTSNNKKSNNNNNNKDSSSSTTIKWPDTLQWIVTDKFPTAKFSENDIIKQEQYLEKNNVQQHQQQQQQTIDTNKNQICFLQFTSGSTSDPKGVMISHNNLGHNLTIITNELQANTNTIVVSWLPQYHDMGLIGSYLGCIYCGGTGYYMSPLSFLSNPSIWIECISKYKATHLQSPNFAFKLTSRKFDTAKYTCRTSSNNKNSSNYSTKLIELNLSCVQHIINAAEPVDEESMRLFYNTFTPYGLPPNVIFPTYGLAEHTVFVCSGGQQILSVNKHELETNGIVQIIEPDSAAASADISIGTSRIVGCGYPAKQNVNIQIVKGSSDDEDATTNYVIVKDDIVGEVWVNSPSKACGYYNKPKETQHDFCAIIIDTDSKNTNDNNTNNASTTYLRTGDLGFIHNDELFICGRLKDLIIIGGRNYYPQDIEATAEATLTDTIVRNGCSAAFTINNPNTATALGTESSTSTGTEEVALVMELRNVPATAMEAKQICENHANQIKSIITQEHSLGLSIILFVKPKTVPKTSSGKIARAWCRKAYINKTLQIVYEKSYVNTQEVTATTTNTPTTISPLEIDTLQNSNGVTVNTCQQQSTTTTVTNRTKLTAEQCRGMLKSDIIERLVNDISEVASIPSKSSIDTKVAIATLMDSLTLSQFKGLFENYYHIQTSLSDDYMLRDTTSIVKLSEIVILGYAPDDSNNNNNNDENGGGGGTMVHQQVDGKAPGLAGALGCPPGVVCVIQ